ncbi:MULTISPECIES: glutathione S-transferase family protein [unclassified Bradyrhizobium]|uniref:glutathione S-transferase family protein n=1 Tax=unclassified Bradyrhizobium TaxID=2631580 RepID=UPI001BAD8F07|nr:MULTISPECIES: glutathione S-transferase family protein [unclassified Bradyrhizobium]MBR1206527.1 glutathione S-transferase family protein [Bradyrhizobium sp. AUGA SZCCT0124]MBR1315495.1 glutathione S-transferase family protein [Bradyrhizobium sp. AUGA SZCCT0051]MBR1338443.1 glutathione S-transferase family protein [Bradyrhizobium sp. AUGA SZCCT0105]MBR1356098.1 glutathione S-transferase family protein [Bradyrhizobium sp. AUGA SZCCT0045]
MAALKLISHKLCPYVQRAVIALHEKGVPFERIDIDLANKPDWFLKISPLGKVPVLVVTGDDGKEVALFESNVICEYIEETQGGAKLHAQDALTRAEHRAWMEFGSAILGDLWGLETATDAATFESKRQAVTAKFARVEAALGAGPFFAGDRFSLVDAVFAPVFRYFDLFDQLTDLAVFTHTPKVRAWRSALAQRPSVRSAVSPDYPALLHAFLVGHRAHMLKLAA